MQFSFSLKAARVNAGFTQEQVAHRLGRNVMTISSWESGKTTPKWTDLKKLSRLYKMEIGALRIDHREEEQA